MDNRNKYYLQSIEKSVKFGGCYEVKYSDGLNTLIKYFVYEDHKNIPISINPYEEED